MNTAVEQRSALRASRPTLTAAFLQQAVSIQSGLRSEIFGHSYANLVEASIAAIERKLCGQQSALSRLGATLKAKLAERLVGWDQAVRTLQATWDRRPIACILAVGPTGVGKTETAKLLASLLFQGRLIALNGSEVGPEGAHGTSMWTGSPPGYVGSDRGGILTNGLRANHSGIILVDEVEKADRAAVQNVLLPLMGDGIITDKNNGDVLHATDWIIICTSNIPVEDQSVRALGFNTSAPTDEDLERNVMASLSAHFPPEVVGRFNAVLRYRDLSLEVQWQVWSQLRHELAGRIGPGTRIQLDEAARHFIQECFSRITTGARGIRDLFMDQVVPLSADISPGSTVNIGLNGMRLTVVR